MLPIVITLRRINATFDIRAIAQKQPNVLPGTLHDKEIGRTITRVI